MRAPGRFCWLLPALAIPACALAAGVAVQAAAFGRAPNDALVATAALRELVRYQGMRGMESLDGRTLVTTCIQGWFRVPGSRLAHGAIVLLGNGERLFDVGSGVRRLLRHAQSRPADLEDRVRFVLAACPHYLDDRFANDLVRGRPVETTDERTDGERASAIVVGTRHAKLSLAVARGTGAPLVVSFSDGRFRGSSDLTPGGGAPAIRRVRRAFDLGRHAEHARA